VKGFSHAQLRVGDVEASVAWYSAAVGLAAAGPPQSGAVAMFGAGGRFAIVISGERPDAAGGELDHIAFGVGDRVALASWGDHLTAAGIEHSGLVESGEGISIHLTDPDGLNVELLAPK
jgi:catechol-2,3-dioxygenase